MRFESWYNFWYSFIPSESVDMWKSKFVEVCMLDFQFLRIRCDLLPILISVGISYSART